MDGTFFCFTLEDTRREIKIPGKTRIPAGEYAIGLRTEGAMLVGYKQRFGIKHRGMIWVRDVNGFEFVYLHVGNSADDTQGCILVGDGATREPQTLVDSASAYRRLYPAIYHALDNGEPVTLRVS